MNNKEFTQWAQHAQAWQSDMEKLIQRLPEPQTNLLPFTRNKQKFVTCYYGWVSITVNPKSVHIRFWEDGFKETGEKHLFFPVGTTASQDFESLLSYLKLGGSYAVEA